MEATRICELTLLENASYIERELPNITLPDQLRIQTTELCSSFIGTSHDIFTERFELGELLTIDTAETSVLMMRVKRIVHWLREDLPKLDQLITMLHAAADTNSDYQLASVLLTESAGNIMHTFNRVHAEAQSLMGDANAKPAV